MAFASLSILGLYEWNTDIFANLHLPQGIDPDVLIPELVTECADFPLLYPDYDFMKMLIGVWSTKELKIWTDMLRSENFEYNPIENYDRYEEITREVSGESESSLTSSSTDTDEGDSTIVNSQTSFNSVSFTNTNKSESDTSGTRTSSGSDTTSSESSGAESITSHMHGNIGVTTAQQMIEGFRDVANFCTYDFIINSFKNRFCLQVY